ncbi:MAG: OsmC family protein [Candidatus Thermoplasmatota archaeon]|nr:OsmC family protein [Candidatus Thermoplasmatota archaeon]
MEWSEEEDEHGKLSMDCGFSCTFHKPVEFGGAEDILNPEDAFVGSLAMCYSITLKSMLEKMKVDLGDFELETKGTLEEKDGKKMITTIELIPRIQLKEKMDKEKVKRALELAEENCPIGNSIKSEVEINPEFG